MFEFIGKQVSEFFKPTKSNYAIKSNSSSISSGYLSKYNRGHKYGTRSTRGAYNNKNRQRDSENNQARNKIKY